jgi:hypothetical protein
MSLLQAIAERLRSSALSARSGLKRVVVPLRPACYQTPNLTVDAHGLTLDPVVIIAKGR